MIDFEDSYELGRITIDTISNQNNSWQIGQPNKFWLSDPKSPQNVIITDTLNSYPINDSSIFSIKYVPQQGFQDTHLVILSGYYKVDSDTLVDFGKIEFSPDNGMNWIDLINNDIDEYYLYWQNPKPQLSGRSEWTYFSIDLSQIGYLYEIQDTVIYRFTFISDSIDNHRDGLMFDDFYFEDYTEGISSRNRTVFLTIAYPNPGSGQMTLDFENKDQLIFDLCIYNTMGQLIYETTDIYGESASLDVSSYKTGVYYYNLYSGTDHISSRGKFIIE